MSQLRPESPAPPTAAAAPSRPSWASEHIVITGGAGFVGSNLVRECLHNGAEVTVLDDFSTGSTKNLPSDAPRMNIVRGSVTDFECVRTTMSRATVVIHAAARNIIVSTRDPREDYDVNIGGTLNVLMAMRCLPNVRRTVYTSSASVYGNPRYLPINEDDHINLLSPYSVSKFAGESYCKAFYESYGISTAVVRYSNVFGPAQRPDNPYCGVIAKFFANAMARQPVSIHGDGEQTRDFSYVDDVVEATLLALFSAKAEGQIYNVGTGRETRINELAKIILEVTGARADGIEATYIDRRDIDNIRRRVVNIEKIRRELRWVPATTVEQGLRKTYQWLCEQAAAGEG